MFPLNPHEWLDSDDDELEIKDIDGDNDGWMDMNDLFPLNLIKNSDNDGDGVGDNGDIDDDNDGQTLTKFLWSSSPLDKSNT